MNVLTLSANCYYIRTFVAEKLRIQVKHAIESNYSLMSHQKSALYFKSKLTPNCFVFQQSLSYRSVKW